MIDVKININMNQQSELSHFINTKVDNAREIMNIINDPSYKSYNDHYDITDNNYYEDLCIKKLETNNFKDNYISNNLTKKQQELILLKYGFKDKVYSSRKIGEITGKTYQAVDCSLELAKKRIKKKYLKHEQRFNK